jgi:hypothetical protein
MTQPFVQYDDHWLRKGAVLCKLRAIPLPLGGFLMRLDRTGDGDFDLIEGAIRIELSRDKKGHWHFWNAVVNGERFGGTQTVSPGPFTEWLDEQADV